MDAGLHKQRVHHNHAIQRRVAKSAVGAYCEYVRNTMPVTGLLTPLGGARSPLWWEHNTVAGLEASLCGYFGGITVHQWEVGGAGPGSGLVYLSEAS
jgi:hypothetical protein